jgi:hypothetical protein
MRRGNAMKLRNLILTAMAALSLLPSAAVRAEEGTGHEADKPGHDETEETLQIPQKLPDLWTLVLQKQAALGEIIKAKELDKVHVTAFQIRDLVQAMPGKSGTLPAESLKKLSESAGRVADVAKLLDEYGDGGDQAKVEEQAGRLGKLLAYVAGLYPAGALGSGRAAAGPHGGVVVTSGSHGLELVAANGELTLFVLNAANQTVPTDKLSAMAMAGPKAETHVSMVAVGDHFVGKLAVPKGGTVAVNVMVSSADLNLDGSFVVSEKGAGPR